MAPSSGLSEIGTLSRRIDALAGEKKKFQSLIEGTPSGILIVQDWKPVFANPAVAKIFGYRGPGALLKLDSLDPLIAPADRPRLLDHAAELLAGKNPSPAIEFQGLQRNERLVWVEFQPRPIEWDGRPAIQITVTDITTRRNATEEARSGQRLLRGVFDALPQWLVVKDPEGRILLVNEALTKAVGKPRDELVGRPAASLGPCLGESRVESAAKDRQVLATGKPLEYAHAVKLPGAPEQVRHVTKTALRDGTGSAIGLVEISQDLTEQKRTEGELRESRESAAKAHARLIDAIESLPGSFALYDSEDRFVLCNGQTRTMFPHHSHLLKPGTPYEAIIRHTVEKGLIEVPPDKIEAYVRDRAREHRRPEGVILQQWADGRRFAVYHRPTSDGGTVSVRMDITEQNRNEEELQKSKNLLDVILDNIPSALSVVDRNLNMVAINRNFVDLLGFPPELARQWRTFEDFTRYNAERGEYGPGDVETLVRERVELARKFLPHQFERVRPDGKTMEIRGNPISDGGFITTYTDISDRKEVEQELLLSEQRFKDFAEASSDWFWEMNEELEFIYVSDRCFESLGMAPENLYGKIHWKDKQIRIDPGAWEQNLDDLAHRRPFRDLEFQVRNSSGKLLTFRVSGKPVFDADSAFKGYRGTGTDITVQVEAERQATEARDRLMDAVNSISEGFVLYDSEDRLELCNSQFRNLFPEIQDLIRPGRSFEEMIRESAARGLFPEAVGDPQAWVEERIRQHRNPGPTYERPISGGRWISGREHRTTEGGIVGIWGDITERKRAEEELRASQRLLQTVFDTLPHSVFVKDRDSRYLMVNNAMAARFNLQPKDFQGAHTMDILGGTEEERKRRVEKDRLVLQTGQRVDVPEFPITTPDGEKRIQHITKLPFLDDSGNVIGVVGVADDITERKRAEEALRVSEKTLSEGQQIAHFGSWTWEPGPQRAHWSDELYRILGYEPQEFEGSFETIVDFVHPEDKAHFSNMLMAVLRGKGPYDFEHRIVRRDRTVRYVHELAEVSHDSEGRTKQVVGTIHDITERTLAERALRESELNLRTLIFNIPVILFSFNAEGKILSTAGKGLELLNLEAGDLVGQNIFELVHNYPEIEEDIRQALRGEQVTSERRYGKFVFEFRYRPVHDAQGKLLSVIGLTVDVTERKRIERQLEEERENLEKTVVERTQDLKQSLASLEDSNLKLQGANLAKSRFLSSMSHELRTPLNAIIGFSDLLRGRHFGPLNDKQAGYVEQIDNAGKHLLSLINDLLDMAKIDAGGMEVQLEAISLGAFFSSIAAMMSSQFRRKNLALAVEIEPGLTTLTADSRKVRQIMLNLLSNAVKFTPAGGRVEIRVAPGGDSEIRIAVADTGIGIEKEELESIFSEFHQAPSARREQVGGTGIGLALTRRLVELHGGTIGVESRIGQGSTFQVVLPKRGMPTGARPAPTGDLAQSESYPSGRRILVAEDNEVNLALILDMLSVHGHATTIARNGQEAVEQARQVKPELIFMDVRMPVMDGLQATRAIREMAEFADLPIIALTASTGPEAETRHLEAGMTEHLAKPIQAEEMFAVLKKYLGGGGPAAGA